MRAAPYNHAMHRGVLFSFLLQWEKLQRHGEEAQERAETTECQIAAISQEYRKLIQEKDVRICRDFD